MARIVSVHSFRGGTGKSNVTANLAANVALRGNRVSIVDTDIQSPGIHVLFGMDEKELSGSLNDYLFGDKPIEDSAHDVSSTLARAGGAGANGALYLVPSSISAGEIARVLREGYDVNLLNDGFHDLIDRLKLDYLFIDTHPGLNEETLLSIAISDVLVVILRPDRQDFQGTAVTIDVARRLNVPRLLVVVNKALQSMDFGQLRSQVEAAYKAEVAGVLPMSEDVMRLASSDLFSLCYPEHSWSQELRRIADLVVA